MSKIDIHLKKIEHLQEFVRKFRDSTNFSPITLHYSIGQSNTTRAKSYKQGCENLDLGNLNEVIHIDLEKKVAIVEPRMTMETLLQTTLAHRFIPLVLPECKGITVGGAIMGGAGESSSHRWGCFNDICHSYHIICGDGTLLRASPDENPEIYYGIASSYGSLGVLVSTEIQLIPAQDFIYLRYHVFKSPLEAIKRMQNLLQSSKKPDFIDGMIFDKNLSVIMEGNLQSCADCASIPLFSLKFPFSEWFYQHVKKIAGESQGKIYQEKMTLKDYFFRYDLGAFWMAAYLFRIPFLMRFISEGLCGFEKERKENFNKREIQQLHQIRDPSIWERAFFRPFLDTQHLWKLLHQAEHWAQRRLIIQDFCIPESNAMNFCEDILQDPAIYPIWLCPIKGTRTSQIFSPHFLSENQSDSYLINFGLYGIPAYSNSIRSITRKLEQNAYVHGGRKVLYSHSYYTLNEFWQIYSQESYQYLRKKTHAENVWHEITEKVLSN